MGRWTILDGEFPPLPKPGISRRLTFSNLGYLVADNALYEKLWLWPDIAAAVVLSGLRSPEVPIVGCITCCQTGGLRFAAKIRNPDRQLQA
jgi:hypothetical protein